MANAIASRTRVSLLIISILAAAHDANAQASAPGSSPSEAHDCKRAAQIVTKGKPEKKQAWAFLVIARCPDEVSDAGAAAIRLMRAESDTAVLFDTWAHFTNVVDGSLLTAFLDVLEDRSASPVARAWAAGALLVMENQGVVSATYRELVTGGANCRTSYLPSLPSTVTRPLSSGHQQTVRAGLETIVAAAQSPAIVKSAAACALTYIAPAP